MRFLVDECTGPAVARWLQEAGHDVFSVYAQGRGMSDEEIVNKAFSEHRILITNDKGFGELIYREAKSHAGIILLRLEDERSSCKIAALRNLLGINRSGLEESFTVVTEHAIRIARP